MHLCIRYSIAGNFQGRSLSQIREKYDFCRENFCGLLACTAKGCHTPNFIKKKTFANGHKTSKFAQVFSLKSFLLYGIMRRQDCLDYIMTSWLHHSYIIATSWLHLHLQQRDVGMGHNLRKSPPLLNALDTGCLDQLLHCTEPLFVRVAQSQEATEQV